MKKFFNRSKPEIPTPENFGGKEIFAFFGLCSYCVQVLEQGLINLTIALNIKNCTEITKEKVENILQKEENRKVTLGLLIQDIKKQINIDRTIERELNVTLKNRNYLIHNFFFDHSGDLLNSSGRLKMINELSDMISLFQKVNNEIDEISHSLLMKLGLTKEMVTKELEKFYSEYRE